MGLYGAAAAASPIRSNYILYKETNDGRRGEKKDKEKAEKQKQQQVEKKKQEQKTKLPVKKP